MHNLEKKIVKYLNGRRLKFFDPLSRAISNITMLVVFWLVVLVAIASNNILSAVVVGSGLAIVFLVHFIVSELVLKRGARALALSRMRPYKRYPEEIQPIGRRFSDSSFPSSHMSSMVGGLIVLVHFYPFLWLSAILVAFLIGWSRLRNGMHYPTDILAGIILGTGYGFLTIWILKILS
ncbi:MAG TPA: phosphatase PAP2 family protein [Patescibacteria group bacterium]